MTIETFTIKEGILDLVIDHSSIPTEVSITQMDATVVILGAPITVGTTHTYAGSIVGTGIVYTTITYDLGSTLISVIADLSAPYSCLLFKTLYEELDELLLQELKAIEMYTIANDSVRAIIVYNRASTRCIACGTGGVPEQEFLALSILNGVKILNNGV
tara:strand:+ start:17927 stop:18403 length:477 start_codon:yes stop_codon:yes gene_type:complete